MSVSPARPAPLSADDIVDQQTYEGASSKEWPSDLKVPAGAAKDKNYYVIETTYRDGRVKQEWFRRNTSPPGTPPDQPQDQVMATVVGPTNTKRKDEWEAEQRKQQAAAAAKPSNVYVGTNPSTGKPSQVSEYPDPSAPGGVRRTYDDTQVPAAAAAAGTTEQVEGTPDPSAAGGWDNSRPRMVTRRSDGTLVTARPLTTAEMTDWRKQQGLEPRAVPQVVPGTLNTQSPRYGVMDQTTGQITWVTNPNYQKPDPKAIPLPPNQKWVIWDNGDGTTRTEKNPNYVPPSKIEKDQATGRFIEITEDAEGKPVVRPVNTQTVIKPADLPVLQARFGELAQGLGALAQDLNGRVARGEMTPEERTQAFTAAHQQANVAVSEINSILENSRASWSQAVQQRGQTLGETQSRRTYAGTMLNNAFSGALSLAQAGGGAASAGAFRELLGLGQRYAAGMGGFRESPEIAMPVSMQQAQGMGLPGLPMPAGSAPGTVPAPPTPPSPPSGAEVAAANAATQAQSQAAFGALGIGPGAPGSPPAPTGAAAPRPWTDITTGPSILPWQGGATPPASTLPDVGQNLNPTLMSSMGSALGPGTFDPTQHIAGMVGANADPAWAEAVRRAAARMGYGRR